MFLTNCSRYLVYGDYHCGDCHLMNSSIGTQKSAIQTALAQKKISYQYIDIT